eukprot:scaffold461_cov321-Pavlova_lutheri.AAC.13
MKSNGKVDPLLVPSVLPAKRRETDGGRGWGEDVLHAEGKSEGRSARGYCFVQTGGESVTRRGCLDGQRFPDRTEQRTMPTREGRRDRFLPRSYGRCSWSCWDGLERPRLETVWGRNGGRTGAGEQQ